MDKNSLIGFGLIAAILIGFSLWNRPSKEELARIQHERDSLALVESQLQAEAALQEQMVALAEDSALNITKDSLTLAREAEVATQKMVAKYGALVPAINGEESLMVVENNLLRLTFQSKGGTLYKAELLDYKAYGDSVNPLCLFSGEENDLGYLLTINNGQRVSTKDLYFENLPVKMEGDSQVVTLRLNTDEDAYLDFVYTIPADDYMIGFKMVAHNMQHVLAPNVRMMEMDWNQKIRQKEKGRRFEERYTQLQYMFEDRDVESLSESKSDKESETSKIRWVAYKDQFFSTVMIADDCFDGATMMSEPLRSEYVKEYTTSTAFAFDPTGATPSSFRMYLGPNKYNTLKAYDKGKQRYEELRLKELVPLGWNVVSWVNKVLIIPMFALFSDWGLNIGLIILLITIIVKLIILPFTYKSYISTAKMRVLRPEMEAINAKYPAEKMQERQQATMALYSKAGVSPMAGCLPMLFQMPVVMALFWFFPTAIELRGQSFLWADDLSTYDAIISWDKYIPVLSWALNNHLSLFTLLFTGTNLIYSYLNMQNQASNDPSANMMKWMMYLMPLMFFFMFNDYASGLSYYYFLSLLFSILQTYIFRLIFTDEKVRAEMAKSQAKRATKKKSGFMARMEEMQREQQKRMREQMKEQAKKNYR